MVHIIPNATTPPRHQSKILTPTRRTAGHRLLAAKVGATQVGKLVGRVAIVDKLPLHLLGLLELLDHLELDLLDLLERRLPQQRTVALQLVAKVPAEVRAAVQKAGPTSSIPTPPPYQDSPVPTAQEQVKEVGRISSAPTPPPLRKSLSTRAAPSRTRATTPLKNSDVGDQVQIHSVCR